MMYWHYTTGSCFNDIVRDGCILPATENVDPRERSIVWFTANHFWEPTANKGLFIDGTHRAATMQETELYGDGLYRIGVSGDVAIYNWAQLKSLSRMRLAEAKRLFNSAIRVGSDPSEWRGTFEPVTVDKWSAVEVMRNKRWAVANAALHPDTSRLSRVKE